MMKEIEDVDDKGEEIILETIHNSKKNHSNNQLALIAAAIAS